MILTKEEQAICRFIAKQRNLQDRRSNVHDSIVTNKQTAQQIDLEGIGAEVAFCRFSNIYPDLTTEPRRGGYDCIMPDGTTVDVKSCRYVDNPYLVVKHTKKISDADRYVLMVGKFPEYSYAGYLPAKEVIDGKNLKNWGYSGLDCYSIPASKLLK